MARYHAAKWRPIPRYAAGGSVHVPMDAPRRLVYHTAVSNATSLFDLFNIDGEPVAHFYIAEDGSVEQYVDTNVRASAELDGNHDCIGVESWDGATGFHGTDGPAWNDAQVEAAAQLAAWVNKTHGIPLRRLLTSRPGSTGVGWHRLGIDGDFPQPAGQLLGGRVSGGETWTTSPGKICPGDSKIRGVVDEIIPRAIEIQQGDDMSAADVQAIEKAIAADGDKTRSALATFRANEVKRYKALQSAIDGITTTGLSADQVKALAVAAVADALAGDVTP